MNEEKIKEIIDRKIENSGDKDNSGIDRLVEEKVKEEVKKQYSNDTTDTGNNGLSRRGFLKALGVGAGGLALSSSVTGASLEGVTTVGGNTVWHEANDDSGSGLTADDVDGYHVEVGGSKPSSPPTDTLFFNTVDGGTWYYNGSKWIQISDYGIVVDDFESGSLDSSWNTSSTVAEVTDSYSYDGQHSLHFADGHGTHTDREFSRPLSVQTALMHDNSTGYGGLYFGASDQEEGYVISVTGDVQIMTVASDGSTSTLAFGPSVNTNEWYVVDAVFNDDGTIKVELYDSNGQSVGSVSATDQQYTSGHLGYWSNWDGTSWYCSYIKIIPM